MLWKCIENIFENEYFNVTIPSCFNRKDFQNFSFIIGHMFIPFETSRSWAILFFNAILNFAACNFKATYNSRFIAIHNEL